MPYKIRIVSVSGLPIEHPEDKGDNAYLVQITQGKEQHKTALKDRGSLPDIHYGQVFELPQGGEIQVSVIDHAVTLVDDKKIGDAKFNLDSVKEGADHTDVVLSHHFHKHVATVHLEITKL
ncbi:hypothetical protein HDU87_000201 [Geranomyces variabilis]|uniref:C2 domain-containing protein n=1 Tax=Geranomyces variabilis TaxID=109894 RepID=A0AAD5XRK0_9FUNG|nr:hypothetical protein HDU87_000201 [Geranomyces variabilis]